jgi:glucan phosphoethanolaminetransferase (alkaline phosphatase superfamily)
VAQEKGGVVGDKDMLQNSTQAKTKKRHGCLTVYLSVVIVGIVIFLFIYLLRGLAPDSAWPVWEILLCSFFALVDIVCLIAIFKWKKWGVWGLCAIQVIGLIVNIIQKEYIIVSIINLAFRLGLLFLVLNIGGEDKGWTQLE